MLEFLTSPVTLIIMGVFVLPGLLPLIFGWLHDCVQRDIARNEALTRKHRRRTARLRARQQERQL